MGAEAGSGRTACFGLRGDRPLMAAPWWGGSRARGAAWDIYVGMRIRAREGGKSQSRAAARTVSGGSITLQRPRPCPDLHSSAELSLSRGFLQRPWPSPPMRCIRRPSPLLIRGSLAFMQAFLPLTLPADTSALRMHKLPRSAVPFRPCACSSKDPGDPARHDFITGRPASGSHALQSATLTRYSGTPF